MTYILRKSYDGIRIPFGETELVEHIKLALAAEIKNWVLFSNGTVIVNDNLGREDELKEMAIKQMKEFGPVHAASEAGDFSIIKLVDTDGWMVTGHGYGMYTYVHPQEIKSSSPHDVEIGIVGMSKRHKDSEELNIIHVNIREAA